jgi:iron complex outermembrane receptor protein
MNNNGKPNIINRTIFNMRYTAIIAVMSAIALAPVHAQESTSDTASAEKKSGIDAMMERIQVTARKREESLQEAPLSVTALKIFQKWAA